MRFWLLSWATAAWACSRVAYSTILWIISMTQDRHDGSQLTRIPTVNPGQRPTRQPNHP
jgi:hypothetical protein